MAQGAKRAQGRAEESTKVVAAKQSPLNRERWVVLLECGHEEWVTAKRRPKRAECLTCKAILSGAKTQTRRIITPHFIYCRAPDWERGGTAMNPLRHFFRVCWSLIRPERKPSPIGFCYHCRKAIYTSYTEHYDGCKAYSEWLHQKGY
jgi:RNase P subunit RPR2